MATKEQRSQALTDLFKRNGEITPSAVVKAAKPRKSPIHDEFDWDDASAAHEHRLAQARRMIRVTEIKISPEAPSQRLVHVPTVTMEEPTAVDLPREGVYKPMEVVSRNPDEYERALKELLTQVRALERSIRQLKASAGKEVKMLPTLMDSMKVAKDTLRLMISEAASV